MIRAPSLHTSQVRDCSHLVLSTELLLAGVSQQLVWNIGCSSPAEDSAENRLQRGSTCFTMLRARDCG